MIHRFWVLATCALLRIFPQAEDAHFVSTPTSVNATLGSTATFNCDVTTGVVAWILNGSLLAGLNAPDIKANQVENMFVLNIPATEEYNNTNVTCALAVLGGNDTYSDPVVLKVQGLLDNVTNLKSESLCQTICLTWDAPFSLDITGVEPDIWYRVDITEAGAPLSSSSTSRIVNISEFNFTMSDYSDTSTSVIHEFRITPINGAGNGTTSASVTGYFRGAPRRITAEVEISVHPLNLNFTIAYGTIPPGEMPDRFQVHVETTDDENTVHYCTDDIPVTPGLNGNVFIQLNASTLTCTHRSNSLKAYRKYNATITAKNGCGGNSSTGEILFSTHEVQRCDVNSHSRPGTVNIKCKFTMKSDALGYLPILSSKTNLSQEIFVVATRDDFSSSDLNISVPGVPQDNYTVTVHDLGSNGLPPVLAGEINYSAEEQSTVVTNAEQAATDEGFSVGGRYLKVPNSTNMSTQVMLCVSFESSTNKETIVLLAHLYGNPQKLLAYYLNRTNCTPAPDAGDYVVGVFNQTGESILKAPATPPNISIITPADIAPVTPTPTVIDQSPFPGGPAVGSTLTVILLVTVVAVVVVFVVCVRTKRKKAGMRVSTDSGDHSPPRNSSPNVENTTYKHIEEGEEAVLKIPADPGDEVKGKSDGTPGLPGSSGAIRLRVCQHRTHDDSGTAPGTAGIPGPAEDSDDSGTAPNNAGIPGPGEDSPPSSYYTGEKPRRFYQKNRSHQHQMFSRTGQTVKFADSIPQAQPKNLWMEGVEDENDNTGAEIEGDAASVSSKPPVLTETATCKPYPITNLKRHNTVPLLNQSVQEMQMEDIEDEGQNPGVGIQDHLMRHQSASEEIRHRGTLSTSKAQLNKLPQPTHPNFVWDNSDTV